jgi:hypothetical protein
MRTRARFVALAAVLAVIGSVLVVGAAGAAPSNDNQAGAVSIAPPLPFHYTEDTTTATVDAGDAVARDYCASVGAPAFEHSVWFKSVIAAGGTDAFAVDVTSSSYGAGIAVLQDNGGTLTALDCVPGTYVSPGPPPAGTYYLVIFGDGTTPATSGTLDLTASVAPAPPTVTVAIAGRGSATKAGGAWVSGTVACSSTDVNGQVVEIDGTVSQTVGRLIIRSDFFSGQSIPCDGATYPWQAFAPPSNGKFSGGKALTASIAYGCNLAGCNSGYAEATVQLTRAPIK